MKRCLALLLLLVTPSLVVAACGAQRRPPNDEITIRLTEPEQAPARSPDASVAGVRDGDRVQDQWTRGGRHIHRQPCQVWMP